MIVFLFENLTFDNFKMLRFAIFLRSLGTTLSAVITACYDLFLYIASAPISHDINSAGFHLSAVIFIWQGTALTGATTVAKSFPSTHRHQEP